MRKILVLRGGALGDFIVTLPALALLRQRWPHAHLEFVGNATAAALAAHLVDRIHSQHESRWSALYSTAPLPVAFAAELATFDLILNFWPDPDGDLVDLNNRNRWFACLHSKNRTRHRSMSATLAWVLAY